MAKLNQRIYDTERLTLKEKQANDNQYFREKIDFFDKEGMTNSAGFGGVPERRRMKVNYDLFNNIIDLNDFSYVCTPFGAEVGELPATMSNKDISSYRIKALLGMEMRRSFGYKIMATNKEATTRKEQEESSRIRDYVISGIMKPIQQEAELKYYQDQNGGRELTPQEKEQIQAQIEAEVAAKTPPEIKKYMQRDHQDPAEVQGNQILEYLKREQDLRRKCNNGFKHALLSAYEVYWVGIVNGKPVVKVLNPMRFRCARTSEVDYIEDLPWASYEFRMHPTDVVAMFDLDKKEIDKIFKEHEHHSVNDIRERMFETDEYADEDDINTVRVLHVEFKGLRKIGWLDFIDAEGVLQTKFLVDENYQLDLSIGDVAITWEWIPATFEGYKIGSDIYKNMGPVAGQAKDLDNLYNCKLSYVGAVYDNMNSEPTCPMDRMKVDQYYYNIVMYRLEMLMATDKGKKIMMNLKAIPASAGIDIEKFQYFMETSPFMWYDLDEEGMNQNDVNTIAKVLDLSLASDIGKYIELANMLDQRCGKSVGVTDPVLGQTAVSERVGNNQQNLVQTSHMLEPYFDLHNSVKKNLLQCLLDKAKIAYINSDLEVLTNVLDDMSAQMFKLDKDLLSNSTLGLFVEDSAMAEEAKQTVRQLAHAAMQNQKIELSDVLAVIKEDSVQEAEESLRAAEEARMQREQASEEAQREHEKTQAENQREFQREEWAHDTDLVITKEREKRITDIQKQAMLSVGFNENKDFDSDGKLDVVELAQDGVAAQIEIRKQNLAERELDHTIENDKEKNKIAKMAKKTPAK